MHNKKNELIIVMVLLVAFNIPSSLGIYKNSSNSSNGIGVADWNVALNQNGISGTVTATAGSTNGTYTLKLVSDSEVDVIYSITVSNIPSGVDVALNNYNNGAFQTPSNGTTTFTDAGIINYTGSSEEVTRTLTFRANSGAASVNGQQVTIDVDFKQN